jgi:hypothetical protein
MSSAYPVDSRRSLWIEQSVHSSVNFGGIRVYIPLSIVCLSQFMCMAPMNGVL